MKKIMILLIILSIIITVNFQTVSYTYAQQYFSESINEEGKKLIYSYIYNDLDQFNLNISVLGKNALGIKKESSPKEKEKFLKELDFILGEVDYEISRIRDDYDYYREYEDIRNGLLEVGIIAANYRFALFQLSNYIKAENLEDEYTNLGVYFRIMGDSESALNNLKKFFPKK